MLLSLTVKYLKQRHFSNVHITYYFCGHFFQSVLRIHDILGWIRIRIPGSMPLTNGSGFWSGFGSGSWILFLLFLSLAFKIPTKNLKVHPHHFSKIEGSGFACRAGSGSGSIPLTSGYGSGSGRAKNTYIRWIRIRIRIRNTAFNNFIVVSVADPGSGISFFMIPNPPAHIF